MKNLILAVVAAIVLLVAAGSASAHHGNRDFNAGFNAGVRAARGGNPHHFNNRSFFNQDGGRNRIGFRR